MPEWVANLSVLGVAIIGLCYVAIEYIKTNPKVQETFSPQPQCVTSIAPQLHSSTLVMTELLILIREQHGYNKDVAEKQQEALQGLVLAVNSLVMLTNETLSRVKDLERGKYYE